MVLAPTKMYRPTDIAFDLANDKVFVVEQFNHRVSRYSYTPGSFNFTLDASASWGTNNDGTTGQAGPIGNGGPTDTSLDRPSGIVFENNRLVVTDTFHNRIRVIDPSNGEFTTSVGTGGFGTTNFYHPAGIAVNDSQTFLVIADELNHRAVRYTVGATPSAPVVLTLPTPPSFLSFVRPHGVVYDVNSDLFNVTDSARGLITQYPIDGVGAIQGQFGTPGSTGHVPAANGTELFFPGSGHGLLTGTVTKTAFADTRNNSIKTVATQTIALTTGATSTTNIAGTGDGQLYYPESVSSFDDSANYVLAANTLNNRVEVFTNDTSGVPVLTFRQKFGAP